VGDASVDVDNAVRRRRARPSRISRPPEPPEPEDSNRTAVKRRAILDAATDLFLRKGYLRTSMEEVASRAAVSKQTVYKQFTDKDELFRNIVLGITRSFDERAGAVLLPSPAGDDAEAELLALARSLMQALFEPRVLRLRRLVIAETPRFPELGQAYWQAGFERALTTIGSKLGQLAERGLLSVDDLGTASGHFAGLLLWIPMNKVMFCGELAEDEIEQHTANGVRAFLSAHRAAD
jgi:TetR/AcrR family transcriptional repressor of mexJK operon